MEKQTKNILTRAFVEKELRFYNKADIRGTILVGLALALIFVPIVLIVLSFVDASSLPQRLFMQALTVFGLGLPVWVYAYSLCCHLVVKRRLNRGEFEIVRRKVTYKSEKIVHRHTETFLSFEGFRDISVDSTTNNLTSPGDVFFIVRYQNENRIRLLYPEKMYEYKEIN